jgi:uncharacterized protein with GYD domain
MNSATGASLRGREEGACILAALSIPKEASSIEASFRNKSSLGKVTRMPSYMVQVSYSSEALAALIANPQDRSEVVKKVAKKLGGKVIGAWLAFGEYDLVMVMEMPDNVSAAAIALASAAGGSCKTVKTTPLLTIKEGLEALEKAGTSGYKPITPAQ